MRTFCERWSGPVFLTTMCAESQCQGPRYAQNPKVNYTDTGTGALLVPLCSTSEQTEKNTM